MAIHVDLDLAQDARCLWRPDSSPKYTLHTSRILVHVQQASACELLKSTLDSAHAPNVSFHAHGQRSILRKSCVLNCARDGADRGK